MIDHAISFNKRHNTKIATSIQENKCYAILPYYGELSVKKKKFKDTDISTRIAPVNTLRNTLVHPKDKQQQSRQSDVV